MTSQSKVQILLQQLQPSSRQDFLRYSTEIHLDPHTAHTELALTDKTAERLIRASASLPRAPGSIHQIQRKGPSSKNLFGHNDHSWALYCDYNKYSFLFNGSKTQVRGPVGGRIGVYLDHGAGALAFYNVTDQTMSLLHRVQTNFSQPLHLGLGFYGQFTGATASLPDSNRHVILKSFDGFEQI
ncbi:hypothetical protein WMY93_008871 [Mugilogobius chulae]|uniref:B30.2/SPRY domain-containing protein n=1 Tax=Mugilogobius chulae TaxID=88201 RepID=A0AAW0PGC3_9GOBI